MTKIVRGMIGVFILFLIINLVIKQCHKNDWFNQSKKKIDLYEKMEKILEKNEPEECGTFNMSVQECKKFKETGEFPKKDRKG